MRLFAAVVLLCAGLVASAFAGPGRGEEYFTNLEVQDQDGRVLKFYDDVLKDKLVVVSFIYTSCQDICPLTTARLVQVQEKLGERMGKDIFFVSLSVDPEVDTPERLKGFAEAFNAGPGWTFITGSLENMRVIKAKLGDRSEKLWEHRNEVVLGNDRTGEWARNSALGDLDRLTIDILQMDPVWRETVHDVSSDFSAVDMPEHPGETLFSKLCSSCHTIGVGNRVGPDLRDVAQRHSDAWLTRFIMDPYQMVAQGDQAAVAVDAAFPNVKMPALGLSETDTADLIAYLKLATERLEEPDGESHSKGHEAQGHDHGSHDHGAGAAGQDHSSN
jgi:protein SCO1